MENKSIFKRRPFNYFSMQKETNDIWHAHFGAAAIASYFYER